MKRIRIILYSIVMFTLFGCKQSELIYSYPNYLRTMISVDLSQTEYTFEDDLLSYNVIFYPIDDGIMPLDELEPKSFRMQRESDFEINIAPGDYQVVMYSDYSGQNAFYSKDKYDEIYSEAQSQATLSGKGLEDIECAAEPDPMVVANMDKVTIEDKGQGVGLSGQTVTFTARPVTTRIKARVWMTNPRSVSRYVGHIGCVDSRYYITQNRTNMGGYAISMTQENSGIVMLSSKNSDGDAVGYLNIQIEMFGFTQSGSTKYTDPLAESMTRVKNDVSDGDAYIYLDIDLPGISDVQTEFKFDITDRVNSFDIGKESLDTIDIGDADNPLVVLPEMIIENDDEGGFNVGVTDWGPEEDFVVDFGSGTVSKQ